MFSLFEPSIAIGVCISVIGVLGIGISRCIQNKNKYQEVTVKKEEIPKQEPEFYWPNSKNEFVPSKKDCTGLAHDDLLPKYRNNVRFEKLNAKHQALFTDPVNHPIYCKMPGSIGDYFQNNLTIGYPCRILVARLDKEIIGALFYIIIKKANSVMVKDLIVAPVHRYKGIGSGLMKKLRIDIGPNFNIQLQDASLYEMPWMKEVFKDEKGYQTSYNTYIFFNKSKYNSGKFYNKLNDRDSTLQVKTI